MINRLLEFLFIPRPIYTNALTEQRARAFLVINSASLLIVLFFVVLLIPTGNFINEATGGLSVAAITLIASAIVVGTNIVLIQVGLLRAAIYLYLILAIGSQVTNVLNSPTLGSTFLLVIPLIGAGVLLNQREFFLPFGVIVALLTVHFINQANTTTALRIIPATEFGVDLPVVVVGFGVGALLLYVFSGSAERIARLSSEDIAQLNAVTQFEDELPFDADDAMIIRRMLNVARETMGYELVGVYLPDENGHFVRLIRPGAVLNTTGTGAASRVQESAVVIQAAKTDEPLRLRAGQPDAVAHIIPPSRASVTIALRDNRVVYGVLDLQARRDVFTRDRLTIIRRLASIAARRMTLNRQLADLRRTVRDSESALMRLRAGSGPLRQAMQSAGGDWESYLRSAGQAALGYDFDRRSGGLVLADDLPEPIRQALAAGDIHVSRQNGTQTISVPIQFRGDPLGAMTFQLPADVPVTDRQRDLLRTISDRLGVALENNRLFERSIAQARRERQANVVGSALLTSTDIEDILDRAVLSFNEALGAIRTEVLIEPKSLIDLEENTR